MNHGIDISQVVDSEPESVIQARKFQQMKKEFTEIKNSVVKLENKLDSIMESQEEILNLLAPKSKAKTKREETE